MAAVQAKVLYDFQCEGEGELSVYSNELVTIIKKDVGDGWWEVMNVNGESGLVPEAYLEQVFSVPEPSHPPPPPPQTYVRQSSYTAAPAQSELPPPPSQPPPPFQVDSGWGGAQNHQQELRNQDSYEDWDDDWDDDDDSSTTTEIPDMPGGNYDGVTHRQQRNHSNSDDKSNKFGTVRKPFTSTMRERRFSQFTKAGGDAYLFDMQPVKVPEAERRLVIMEGTYGPCWKPLDDYYKCIIRSPKKETKYHGMKSFIAYQLTPTVVGPADSPLARAFSNIQVSRRYKHFDWLHKQLVEKYSCVAVPPLPEKQISGRFEEDFILMRLRALQLWMDRMCTHPVIAGSDVMVHFLSCTDEKRWKVGKRKAEKDDYTGGKFFFTVTTPPHALDAKVVDQQMERFGRFVKSMDDSAKHLLTIAENGVRKYQGSFKKEHMKLGGSFIALAKSFEFDERPAAQPLTRALEHSGKTYEDIGRLFAGQPELDFKGLMEGLQEYRGILSTFPDILAVQRAATQKIQESAGRLNDSEMATVQSRADVITYTTQAEMSHFHEVRVGDFKGYMQAFLQSQIQFHQRVTQMLQETLQAYDQA